MARRELTEAEWLRRAIRHCEFWGRNDAIEASFRASATLGTLEDKPAAKWLPKLLRGIPVHALRSRLAALESEAA